MADKKLAALQNEIKLLKGEVKQSLASVRDYLLNMELPSSEISTILAALGGDGEQKVTMRGSFEMPKDQQPEAETGETTEAAPAETEETIEEVPEDDIFTSEETIPDGPGDDGKPFDSEGGEGASFGEGSEFPGEDGFQPPVPEEGGDYPGDELLDGPHDDLEDYLPEQGLDDDDDEGEPLAMDNYHNGEAEILASVPKVNMMANLITWVSRAIRDIGYDQLPVFLEVYGISGHLAPEMKDVILHLAELTAEKHEVETSAGIWSEQMLSLHGILTGGETPLHPVIPSWGSGADISDQLGEDEIMDPDTEEEQEDEAPVKLKLVFPNGNGEPREYSIDLSPGALAPEDAPPKKKQA